ncbi:uncharacterized protein LACBIDRAFT_316593 [Laccaria bicolor S238N-H82]|uniref:Predicted protein n=1 Tax=Laccaria bicolor (strain S238N-H82 / ATCC MYA-4686) TaxID=486041 RepID=B0E184_LACBS|nr:uncharacterized protein LACBIDRAFT_316593 [Laccaria bicolor S238N-H82]EDQ99380.1 predicted protein [Laccaria bicolor S238N-H82]|eukprot:XP_001889931.1 predicted protein [Laccaria bicolor S238N-H82]
MLLSDPGAFVGVYIASFAPHGYRPPGLRSTRSVPGIHENRHVLRRRECDHVLVRLHDHLWNGSRFGMVIAVGVYEDGVPVAKVHAFHRYCMVVSSSPDGIKLDSEKLSPVVPYPQLYANPTSPSYHLPCYHQGMIILGFANSELILTLRAWAVWNRNKYLAIFLPTLCGTAIIANLVVMGIFLKDLKIGPQPYPDFLGCLVSDSNHILYMCWVILTSYEFVILILMIIPGIEAYWAEIRHYMKLFFGTASCLTSTFSLCQLSTSSSYSNSPPERVLHCLLSSRVLLHIRAQMTVRQSAWSDGFTDIEFNDETNEPIGFRLHPTNSGLSPR